MRAHDQHHRIHQRNDLRSSPGPPDAGADSGGDDGGAPTCTDELKDTCFAGLECYTDIFKPCAPSGMCTAGEQVVVNNELVAPFCFENGVKLQSKTKVADPFLSTLDYYKSGGDFCWHADSASTSGGENTLVYKDMNGNELATVKTFSDKTQTVACAGMPEVKLDAACSACIAPADIMCVKGACSVP